MLSELEDVLKEETTAIEKINVKKDCPPILLGKQSSFYSIQ